MDQKEELEWRRRYESKVDKLFEIVTDIRIICAGRNCDTPEGHTLEVPGNDITGREKFLLALLSIALTVIGILVGISVG